jgi:hypothetical protein
MYVGLAWLLFVGLVWLALAWDAGTLKCLATSLICAVAGWLGMRTAWQGWWASRRAS